MKNSISSIQTEPSLLQGVQGAILDLDGTLLDSLYVWRDAGKNYLASLGVQAEEGLSQKLFNMTMTESARYFMKEYFTPQGEPLSRLTEKEIISSINNQILAEYKNRVQFLPGALEALNFLKSLGKKITAATTGDRLLEEAALTRLCAIDFFEKIFYCTELDTGKNESRIFLTAARFMNLPPQKILVVDDSPAAIQTARDAGFRTLLVG